MCLHVYMHPYGLMSVKISSGVGGGQMERERCCGSAWDSCRMAVGDGLL